MYIKTGRKQAPPEVQNVSEVIMINHSIGKEKKIKKKKKNSKDSTGRVLRAFRVPRKSVSFRW